MSDIPDAHRDLLDARIATFATLATIDDEGLPTRVVVTVDPQKVDAVDMSG